MITILLADDHAVVREGLRALLEIQSDLRVVATACDGREAVRYAKQHQPNVAVLDIGMPELNGIESIRAIHDVSPLTQVVILSVHSTTEHIYRSFQAGALGYVLKESVGSEVVSAVHAVADGKRYVSHKVSETIFGDDRALQQAKSPLESLSSREREVLQLVVEGKSAVEVGEILALSPKTVETYRSRLMHKLGVSDLPALVRFAIQHGVIALE